MPAQRPCVALHALKPLSDTHAPKTTPVTVAGSRTSWTSDELATSAHFKLTDYPEFCC